MTRDKLTWKQAREAARYFVWEVTDKQRRWTTITAEGYLPSGWWLPNDATEDQFFPITIEHVACVYRQIAVWDDNR